MTTPVSNTATGSSFWGQLKPASFRKLPFTVAGGRLAFGRRNAVHEYPFRDTVWVEDMGRQARRIQMTGFIHGDDVIAQRDRFIAAAEKGGDGELVHPTLGVRQVALLDVSSAEGIDGRYFELQFTFVEQGRRLYPEQSQSSATTTSADGADTADAESMAQKMAGLHETNKAAAASARAAASFTASARSSGASATMMVRMAAVLSGSYGRMLRSGSGISLGQVLTPLSGVTMQSLAALAAGNRQAISLAGTALAALSLPGSPAAWVAGVQAVVSAVQAAAPTPGDALLALQPLAVFSPTTTESGDALAAHAAAVATMQRASVAAMARVAATYQPASAADAMAVRDMVAGHLDRLITAAGDAAEDGVYAALAQCRADVVRLMNEKGAQLPTLTTVSLPAPLPALSLAQRLYRDPGRADDLIERAQATHPAFMPNTFEASNR